MNAIARVLNLVFISTIYLTFVGSAQAADVVMTATQQQSLGVTVTPVGKNTMLSSRRFPAEIVVPVGQERVVSAPQSCLIDQLFVAAGQQVNRFERTHVRCHQRDAGAHL